MTLRERAERFWTQPSSPLRSFWLARGLFALLTVDAWFEMIQHGGRYGLGDFNVAHFTWIDWVLGTPTATLYVGLLIASGALSFWLTIGRGSCALRIALTLLYTTAWLVSVHDSYQHHYFLSWMLAWSAAMPELDAETALREPRTTGWGVRMSALTCAIVYAFTGISKSEPDWRSGDALRSITHAAPPGSAHPGKFDGARDALLALGLDEGTIWGTFAIATIALQWTIAVAYAASAGPVARSRLRSSICMLGLFGALSFHVIAELFHVFEIGLFSYYMIFIAFVLLGPSDWLRAPTTAAAWLRRRAERWLQLGHETATPSGWMRAAVGVALLVVAGFSVPLPGAAWAASVVALLVAFTSARAGALDAFALRVTALAFVFWASFTQSTVPFDYYRRTAGELSRMGLIERAIEAYRVGEQYAPAGQSRRARIHELEQQLRDSTDRRR